MSDPVAVHFTHALGVDVAEQNAKARDVVIAIHVVKRIEQLIEQRLRTSPTLRLSDHADDLLRNVGDQIKALTKEVRALKRMSRPPGGGRVTTWERNVKIFKMRVESNGTMTYPEIGKHFDLSGTRCHQIAKGVATHIAHWEMNQL